MTANCRLDRWLWVTRFFKTRALAAAAVDGGKVHVNGARTKRARLIQPGDRLRVRLGPFEHDVVVRDVAERRGSAAVARRLYEETAASRDARERLGAQLRLAPSLRYEGKGRPTKRERREIERLRASRKLS